MLTEAAKKAEETLIHILWINAGLSCDGDSVALTGATQPSVEEIALGALPGLPQVAVHWPLIDFECGPNGGADDFLSWFFKADRGGELEPFVLVVEGSIPQRESPRRGLLVRVRQRSRDGPADDHQRMAGSVGAQATAVVAVGTCATYGGIHAMAGNPTGAMGVPRLPRVGVDEQGRHTHRLRARLPDPGRQPLRDAGLPALHGHRPGADDPPRRRAAPPPVAVRQHRSRGCDRAGYYEQGDFAKEYGSPKCIVKLGCWGSGGQVQRAQAWLDQRRRWMPPQRRRHLHRLHHAWLPGQVHAPSWTNRPAARSPPRRRACTAR